MDLENRIEFLIREDLEGYCFNPQNKDGIDFSDPEGSFRITIKSKDPSDKFRYGFDNLELCCFTSRRVSSENFEFVEALLQDRYLPSLDGIKSLPISIGDLEIVDSTGLLSRKSFGVVAMLPADLKRIVEDVNHDLRAQSLRFVELLRWQLNAPGPNRIFREMADQPWICWRTAGNNFRYVPMTDGEPVVLSGYYGAPDLKWGAGVEAEIEALLSDPNAKEPLAHQLLREARGTAPEYPRSALLIAHTALEFAVKEHISKKVPDAEWLAMNIPSPPIHKILKQYFPKLHDGKQETQNWDKLGVKFSKIEAFSNDRNKLTHSGAIIKGDLDEYLQLVEDFLYTIDVLEGRDWARRWISLPFRNLLGWTVSADSKP